MNFQCYGIIQVQRSVKNSLNSNVAVAYYSLAKFDTRLSQKNAFLKKACLQKVIIP